MTDQSQTEFSILDHWLRRLASGSGRRLHTEPQRRGFARQVKAASVNADSLVKLSPDERTSVLFGFISGLESTLMSPDTSMVEDVITAITSIASKLVADGLGDDAGLDLFWDSVLFFAADSDWDPQRFVIIQRALSTWLDSGMAVLQVSAVRGVEKLLESGNESLVRIGRDVLSGRTLPEGFQDLSTS